MMLFLVLNPFMLTAEAAVPVNLLGVGDLVITEVMHSTSSVPDYRGEWVEVYNNTTSQINLNGLVLSDGTDSITVTSNLFVNAGQYIVLGTRWSNLNGGAPTSYIYSNNALRLSADEQISLIADGTTLDTFDWDYGINYPSAFNTSISLSPGALNSTDNDNSANWCLPVSTFGSVGLYGTPGSANDSCSVDMTQVVTGDLVITEVMFDPTKTAYYRGEWFEIYNASSKYININGLIVNSGPVAETFTIDEDINIRPGEFVVVANRTSPLYNGGMTNVSFDYNYTTSKFFPNDVLNLSYDGTLIDSFTWTSDYVSSYGIAINLDSRAYDATSNDSQSAWCDAVTPYGDGDYGTPGTGNAECTGFDNDNDGFTADEGDCDDSDASVNPNATEVCDGVDNDCNGDIDDNTTDGSTYYADLDGDGYGDAGSTTTACAQPTGYVTDNTDCDDSRSLTNPGAAETCDGIDNDCDTIVDNNATDGNTYYEDTDSDGYGADNSSTTACEQPSGYVLYAGDCDDSSALINPGIVEACDVESDLNCDGFIGGVDNDGDGFTSCEECNDSNININPNATEVCDGVDNDCDGSIDDGSSTDALTWYQDGDTDGFGDLNSTTLSCTRPTGYISNSSDCDDTDNVQYPGAPEVCNNEDDDCDNQIDEAGASGASEVYADTDGDTYGDPNNTALSCLSNIPTGYVTDNTDCDDSSSSVNTSATEVCDSIDNDCDGDIDDNDASVDTSTGSTFYLDADNDLYGDPSMPIQACTQPTGYKANNLDCDDTSYAIKPNASEICDTIDNDCDGLTDDADPSLGGTASEYYLDSDTDGYGDPNTLVNTCSSDPGYVTDNTDCDDSNININPGETEICDGIDNNCSGDEADAPSSTPYYADTDGDTYGDPNALFNACIQPSGYVTDSTDCDDSDVNVNPGATEICDEANTDEDCNGLSDDADIGVDSGTFITYYKDTDLDFYGDDNDTLIQCDRPASYRVLGGDCNEADVSINPGATEVCDGIDNNCSGTPDDGLTFEDYYTDSDGDGYGDVNDTTPTNSCSAISGEVTNNGDCDDGDASRNPGATEICLDDIDQDCDGSDSFSICEGSVSDADVILDGLSTSDVAGWGISPIGDFNGDGNADFMLSTRGTNFTYVFFGPLVGNETLNDADLIISGSSGDALAASGSGGIAAPSNDPGFLSIDGDINGDGFGDLLLGTNTNGLIGASAGAVYLIYGGTSVNGTLAAASSDVIFTGENSGDFAGQAVSMVGDINNDGVGDIAIGAPRVYEYGGRYQAGRTYIFYGNASTPLSGTISLSSADVIIGEARSRDRLGLGLDGIGDITGDGIYDLAVGAYRRNRYTSANHPDSCDPEEETTCANSEGQVLVWAGGTLAASETPEDADLTYIGAGTYDNIGETVSGAGDIDGDGTNDLAFGSSYYQNLDRKGVYYLAKGTATGEQVIGANSNIIASIVGTNVGDQLGRNATRLGDMNGDGHEDFAVSARGLDTAGTDAGAIYIFLGPLSGTYTGTDADVVIDGEAAGDFFGGDIKAAGDIDNDGNMDLMISATSANSTTGAVYLLYGSHF